MIVKLIILGLAAISVNSELVDGGITSNNTLEVETDSPNEPTKLLSRRKRFLVFPDGSSFQLVFCAQNQGYIQIGDVVWFGNTAALAWELPTDPKLFYMFKDYKKVYNAKRRGDNTRNIYYLDEQGKLIAKVPFKRKQIIVNPAFAKRSVDYLGTKQDLGGSNGSMDSIAIALMHKMHQEEHPLKCKDATECNNEFHREGRKNLYEKLETFMNALGWKGRQCVLRMLCEGAKEKSEQGTFLEEIMRAVFTLPGGHEFNTVYHKEYDIAHKASNNCSELYPECVNVVDGQSF